MIDERLEPRVVLLAIREPGGSHGLRADYRNARVFEFKELFGEFDGHFTRLREDDDGIGRAAGERDFAVLKDGAVEEDLRTATVEIPEEFVLIGGIGEGGVGRDVDGRRLLLVEE